MARPHLEVDLNPTHLVIYHDSNCRLDGRPVEAILHPGTIVLLDPRGTYHIHSTTKNAVTVIRELKQ